MPTLPTFNAILPKISAPDLSLKSASTIAPSATTLATNTVSNAVQKASLPTFDAALPKISAPDLSLKSISSNILPTTNLSTSGLGISTVVPFSLPVIPEFRLPGSGIAGILRGASPTFSANVLMKFKSIALGGGIGTIVSAVKTVAGAAASAGSLVDQAVALPGEVISSADKQLDSQISSTTDDAMIKINQATPTPIS